MANVDILKPTFYPDLINYYLSRGVAQDGNFDVVATDAGAEIMGTFVTGSEPELFDMKPLNLCTFGTSTDVNGNVIITIDTQVLCKKSFVAVLNHNLNTCTGRIRIGSGNALTDIDDADLSNADNTPSCTEVVNADTIATNVITPASDGHTIVTFSESTDRYWGIQFEGNDSGDFHSSTNFSVGCIMIGEFYQMPHSPNLDVKRSISYDTVNIQESLGGQRYSNTPSFGRQSSSTSKSPFTLQSGNEFVYGGRMIYDMKFSYLNSTDLMPNDYSQLGANLTDDAVVEDIWNKTNGRHIPFIFTADGSSTSESDYLFARFGNDRLDMTQVANDIWDISLKIEEEF